jgi:hypothetical protein
MPRQPGCSDGRAHVIGYALRSLHADATAAGSDLDRAAMTLQVTRDPQDIDPRGASVARPPNHERWTRRGVAGRLIRRRPRRPILSAIPRSLCTLRGGSTMSSTGAPAFTRTAPADLAPPDQLVATLRKTEHTEYIDRHGFGCAQLKPGWWDHRGITIDLPSCPDGEPALTRGDLFQMARDVSDDASLLAFLWHVLAWGSGTSRRNNVRRIDSCEQHIPLLRSAFDAARGSDPRTAYGTLIRRGGAQIPHFGPAFFSKFLYFASEDSTPRCLILDARVARSLWSLGWSMAPTYRGRSFSYNWYTDTYVSYCTLLESWAATNEYDITADMFERALFDGLPSQP